MLRVPVAAAVKESVAEDLRVSSSERLRRFSISSGASHALNGLKLDI
jgi:hypothetical protein